MPSRKVHNMVARMVGIDERIADEVNAWKDRPARWLGPNHRAVRHDAISNILYASTYGDRFAEALMAGELHDLLDRQDKLRKAYKILDALL